MSFQIDSTVRIKHRPDLGIGQIIRLTPDGESQKADVVFERDGKRVLETFPASTIEPVQDIFQEYASGKSSRPIDFALKQLAWQFPLENLGGELSNSRTDLLPHQILLTHQVVRATRRRFLVADEVGLGKTIETGMILRELMAMGEGNRVLVICPAGLTDNWQNELKGCFRIYFERLGYDFNDTNSLSWETHNRVIVSIDTIKQPDRLERLMSGPKWDCIVVDEAHHLSRKRYGRKTSATQNYRLAERIKDHTKNLLFLSATPHQGNAFQFWSLIQLLDDQLFENPDAMQDHRGLLNRVMFRRTKREVTDADGNPIFMRRQVHTQSFQLSLREQRFYERLSEYLKEGYAAADVEGTEKTTSNQRAVGFLMATFQKIMSSSPRAIKQALRRRLLSIYARKQMGLESGHVGKITTSDIAVKITQYQEAMRKLVADILAYEKGTIGITEADAYILKVKQRLTKRPNFQDEITDWALDAMEDNDRIIEAEANIPNEEKKIQELIDLVDERPDRKFDTLVRAIEQLRRENEREKMIIFTQYLETVFFLKEELGKYYDSAKIAVIRGGPLEDKIAACESFWDEDGAQFLLATSAGGEGINLQVCRVLFNYDLPWNPMAVEQRIGRIHRYGQTETAQVYNLVAEGTIEERVYAILESKLLDIARTIGKVDSTTGQVTEDFRSEILGFLGSAANYNELYKTALVNRDYQRTEREIEEAMAKAREASNALRQLTQDLSTFNLEKYIELKGKFTLEDLKVFTERAILALGGGFIPSGDTVKIVTPSILMNYPNVAARYDNLTFVRKVATRKKGVELMGLGHPLMDALIAHYRSDQTDGRVLILRNGDQHSLSARYLLTAEFADGTKRDFYETILLEGQQSMSDLTILPISDGDAYKTAQAPIDSVRLTSLLESVKATLRSKYDGIINIRDRCVGIFAFTHSNCTP